MELFTALSLVFALAAAGGAWMAWKFSGEAGADADNLRRTLGRIAALESEHATIMSQIAKLRGKVYSLKPDPWPAGIAAPAAAGGAGAAVCENYLTAQSQGPRSEAAACECDYCVGKREERSRLRAAILPRPQSAKRNGG